MCALAGRVDLGSGLAYLAAPDTAANTLGA
jgi:hypothetical protein